MFNTEKLHAQRPQNRSAANNASHGGATMPAVQTLKQNEALRAPVLQRVPLDIEDLDTNNMGQIESYLVLKLKEGRRDLITILQRRIEKRDGDKLPTFLGLLQKHNEKYKAPKTRTVPQQMHIIWMGDRIKDAACDNILQLHKNLKEGWKLTLWTDKDKTGFLSGSPGSKLVELARDGEGSFEIKEVNNIIDRRIAGTYKKALEKNAYSMASDLARYSILFANGGVYMDVDLGIGEADPSKWNLEVAEHGLSALGPNLRDKGDRDKTLESGLLFLDATDDLKAGNEHQGNLKAFVDASFNKIFGDAVAAQNEEKASKETIDMHKTMPDKDKSGVAARVKYMNGLMSNQFIAAPPNHVFIDFLLDILYNDLEKPGKDWNPEQVASLTGPSKFSTVIAAFYASRDKLVALEQIERRHLVDPKWISQISTIQWLTAESENQIGKESEAEKKDATASGDSSTLTKIAILAGAALAIGAGYYLGHRMKLW